MGNAPISLPYTCMVLVAVTFVAAILLGIVNARKRGRTAATSRVSTGALCVLIVIFFAAVTSAVLALTALDQYAAAAEPVLMPFAELEHGERISMLALCPLVEAPTSSKEADSEYGTKTNIVRQACVTTAMNALKLAKATSGKFASPWGLIFNGILAMIGMLMAPHLLLFLMRAVAGLEPNRTRFIRWSHVLFLGALLLFLVGTPLYGTVQVSEDETVVHLAAILLSPFTLPPIDVVSHQLGSYLNGEAKQMLLEFANLRTSRLYQIAAESALILICLYEILKENVVKPMMADGLSQFFPERFFSFILTKHLRNVVRSRLLEVKGDSACALVEGETGSSPAESEQQPRD